MSDSMKEILEEMDIHPEWIRVERFVGYSALTGVHARAILLMNAYDILNRAENYICRALKYLSLERQHEMV